MQFKLLISAALLATTSSAAVAAPASATTIPDSTTTPTPIPSCFTQGIQQIIPTVHGYITNVILDVTQEKHAQLASDYTTTGRGLSYFERSMLPEDGCAPSTLAPASTRDQALAGLQGAQAELNVLAQDAINGDCDNGRLSLCRAVDLYESVAPFVNSVRTG